MLTSVLQIYCFGINGFETQGYCVLVCVLCENAVTLTET